MKRFISCVLCTLLLVGALAAPAFAAFDNSGRYVSGAELKMVDTFTIGDLDDNGSIALKDILQMRKYITDKSTVINASAADIAADGKVTTKDLLALRKHIGKVEDLSKYESEAIVNNFTIAGNDITDYCIIVPQNTKDTNTVYGNAASLLRRYVNMATDGYVLEIDQTMTSGKSHAIRFVEVDEASEMGQKLEIENYIYEVDENGDLNIYSTRRGALHAIYDILEDYLGFRFYNNYIIHEYETRYVDIPEGTYVFVNPVLDFRHCSQSFGSTNVGDHRHPRHLNGSQAGSSDLKWGTQTGPEFINAHSYGYYWKMGTGYANWDTAGQIDRDTASASQIKKVDQLYGEKYNSGYQHDELNWNPCFVSDDDYEVLFRGLLETIRYMHTWREFRFPTSSMSFSICDSPFLCSCTECRFLSKSGTMEIAVYGKPQPDVVECLGGGGAAQCLYLANRGAKDIQEYYEGRAASEEWYYDEDEGWDETMPYGMPIEDAYPGLSLYTIFYDHALPLDYENLPAQDSLHSYVSSVNMEYIPLDEHIIIMFCGTACNNHYVGTKDCNGSLNVLGGDPDHDVDSLKAWGQACKDAGAQMWYWYYPVSYCSHIVDSPNITNIYHDIKFLVEECNVNGVYYEGTSQDTYQFEFIKAHLASVIMYEMTYDENGNMTIMSEEEFHEAIKEYLYLYYGDGYEYVYEYLLMYEAASDAISDEPGRKVTCYINNHDRPGDMFSYYYIQDNYLEMRQLLLDAIELADDEDYTDQGRLYDRASQKERIQFLLAGCDTLGLSANYKAWWADPNASEADKEFYMDTYAKLHAFIKMHGLSLYSNNTYVLSETVEYDKSPLHSFNGAPSWNSIDNGLTWGASDDMPDWGFHG